MNQTSVCADAWRVYDECPTCHCDTIERTYNVFKDNNHNELFEYLEAIMK